jgi:hypothetical protein
VPAGPGGPGVGLDGTTIVSDLPDDGTTIVSVLFAGAHQAKYPMTTATMATSRTTSIVDTAVFAATVSSVFWYIACLPFLALDDTYASAR